MASQPHESRQTGAVAVDRRRRGGAGWLSRLLPLLLLLALAILLISLLGGDDDNGTADRPQAQATPTATADQAASAEPSTSADGATAGVLSSNGQTLRGDAPDSLAAAIGQRATGRGARVLSVVEGTGFWVGTSRSDRTFVEWGAAAGGNEKKEYYRPEVGDTVDLRGPVRVAPADPAEVLKIGPRDAERVKAQGAYINADRVQKAR